MIKRIHFIGLFLLVFLLSGCWDLNENERMFYVHGLGIDFKDGKYEVYIQIISFGNVAKSEQVTQDIIQSEVTSKTGETFTEALFQLYRAIDERVYWGHLSFFVLSEEAMKDGRINSVINTLTQFSDMRYQTWVYCTDENLEDILLAVPLLKRAITLTTLADPYNTFDQTSYLEPVNVRKLIIRLNEPSHNVAIPYVKMNKNWKSQQGEDESVEVAGVGIVTPKEFKGFIKGEDAKGVQWLSKEMTRGQVTSTINSEGFITLVLENYSVKTKPILEAKGVQFDIQITTDVTLNSYTNTVTKKDIQKVVKKQLSKEIETTFKEGLERDIDIYRLSEILYRSNVKKWRELQTKGVIELTEDSLRNIDISINKINSGRKSFRTTIE